MRIMAGFERIEGLFERHSDLIDNPKSLKNWATLAIEGVGWIAEICQTLESINNVAERSDISFRLEQIENSLEGLNK